MAPPVFSPSGNAQSAFERPILCAVLDLPAIGDGQARFARDLFRAGVDWIQVRDRAASAEALLQTTRQLIAARDEARRDFQNADANTGGGRGRAGVHAPQPRVLLNKRVDVAIATSADGVHLGGDALSPVNAARILPETALIGASFHAEDEVSEARQMGLTYAHLAPIWDPRSKPAERPALGLIRLGAAAGLGLPLIAQGGIDADRAAQAIAAGAAGIAVTGLLTQAKDPISAARALREALDRSPVEEG